MSLQIVPYTEVMLAVTYDCTCQCKHCSAALYKNKNLDLLQKNEIFLILEQLSKLGVYMIYFFGGEPLLNKYIYDYIYYARSLGLKTRLDTNGTLLNFEVINKLKVSGLDLLGISLDSPLEEVHDQARENKGLFRKNIENIIYAHENGVDVFISGVATKQNIANGELLLMTKLAEFLNVPLRLLSAVQCGRWNNAQHVRLNQGELGYLKSLLKKDKVFWERVDQDDSACSFRCSSLIKSFFYISAYGEIQPCWSLPIAFGNLRDNNLIDVLSKMWNSKLYACSDFHDCPVNSDYLRELYQLDKIVSFPQKAGF